jgi:hypothetical protein
MYSVYFVVDFNYAIQKLLSQSMDAIFGQTSIFMQEILESQGKALK